MLNVNSQCILITSDLGPCKAVCSGPLALCSYSSSAGLVLHSQNPGEKKINEYFSVFKFL